MNNNLATTASSETPVVAVSLNYKHNDILIRAGFNLIDKYKNSGIEQSFNVFKEKVIGFSDENKNFELRTGDTIKFVGGYDGDIEFTSKILGFDRDGHAFVLWDCYWYPVNLNKDFISKV